MRRVYDAQKNKKCKELLVSLSKLSRFFRTREYNALGSVKPTLIDVIMMDTAVYNLFAFATEVLKVLTALRILASLLCNQGFRNSH